MRKTLCLLLFLLCSASAVQASTVYLVDGKAEVTQFAEVDYLEHVDISIVKLQERQISRAGTRLYADDERQLNSEVEVPNPDPILAPRWHIEQYKLAELARYESIRPTVIAVIDTGIFVHEEMMPYLQSGYNVLVPETVPLDDHGHGTALASVMVDVIGMADVQIVPIKAADNRGSFKVSNIVKAIDLAIEEQVDIINLSFGATKPDEMEEKAVAQAIEAGIVVVSSSGNTGRQQLMYPAAYDGVVSISSINEQEQKASFSTSNEQVDFTAPGENMLVHKNLSTTELVLENGTSFSSAYVSALFATLKSLYYTADVAGDMQAFTKDLGELGRDDWFGLGLIEPLRALEILRGPLLEAKQISDPQKTWTVTFSKPVTTEQDLEKMVQLINASGEAQPVTVTVSENRSQLFIEPIESLVEGTYWLIINQSLQSMDAEQLNQAAHLKFELKQSSVQS